MLDAYVLHAINYKDTSLIVKFFTKEYGIIHLVAHGARRPKSQFFGILQPFTPLFLYWKARYVELATLHKAESNGAPYRLQGSYLFGALYVNELFLKLLAQYDPNPELFENYHKLLCNLNQATKSLTIEQESSRFLLEKNLRFIEKKLLKTIGYEIQLNTNIKANDELYKFDIENGLQIYNHEQYSNFMQNNDSVNNAVISGNSLTALYYDDFTDIKQLQEAKLFMRKILSNFLGNKSLAVKKLFS